jgi:S-DNA-T family DNA segregation ATPase FtsK/SpoIIIE
MREVAEPTFERSLMQIRSGGPAAEGSAGDGEGEGALPNHDGIAKAQNDPLFEKAVEIVLETQKGSVSMLQRRLAIGYTRSSRLMDALWKAGIVGNHKGTVDRDVLITPGEWEAMKAQAAADAAAAGEGTPAALFEESPPAATVAAQSSADAAAEEEALRFHDEPEPAHPTGNGRAPF